MKKFPDKWEAAIRKFIIDPARFSKNNWTAGFNKNERSDLEGAKRPMGSCHTKIHRRTSWLKQNYRAKVNNKPNYYIKVSSLSDSYKYVLILFYVNNNKQFFYLIWIQYLLNVPDRDKVSTRNELVINFSYYKIMIISLIICNKRWASLTIASINYF